MKGNLSEINSKILYFLLPGEYIFLPFQMILVGAFTESLESLEEM